MPGEETALARRECPADRSFFSLEMDREGVRLTLRHASMGDLCSVSDLVLRVPHVRFPFDYGAGPRALASHLSILESVTMRVSLRALSDQLRRRTAPGLRLESVSEVAGRLVASGSLHGVAFTTRIDLAPGAGEGADLRLIASSPRVYGLVETPWTRIPAALGGLVPPGLDARSGRGIGLRLVRPLLASLLAPMGFKVPITRRASLIAIELGPTVLFRFGEGARPANPEEPETARFEDPEDEALEALDEAARNPGDASACERFLSTAVALPRLLPEVFARGVAAGEEWPERVVPHLAAVVAGSSLRDAPADALARACARLMASLDDPGEAVDLVPAARLVASVSDRLSPEDALAILNPLQARVPDPAVLDATARAIERSGHAAEAAPLRARAVALSPAGRAVDTVSAMVDRAVACGLADHVPGWLEHLMAACDDGRFGSEGPGIRRRAELSLSSLLALSGEGRARARELIRTALDRSPADREALDLLVALAANEREAAEAAMRLRAAAAATGGAEAADLLLRGAAILSDRAGLRRQAVALAEEAAAQVPGDARVEEALDAAYERAGMTDRRRALAERRLAAASSPEERARLLALAARLAEAEGDMEAAAEHLASLVEVDPGDRGAIEAARRVSVLVPGCLRLREALAEFAEPAPGRGPRPCEDAASLVEQAEKALSNGDVEVATGLLERALCLDPDVPGGRALLSSLYQASGRPDLRAVLEDRDRA